MGQLRTANKRHKRALAASRAPKAAAADTPKGADAPKQATE